MTKSNNPEASEKKNPSHQCGVGQGVHDAGKPIVSKEGDGYHSGRKVPVAEAVREIDPNENAGKAIECEEKQNRMDDGQLAQTPAGRNFPTTTSSNN